MGAERWHGTYIKATRPPICYHNHHLRQPDTDMDDRRASFYKLKKNIKHLLTEGKRNANNLRAGGSGEKIGPSDSLPRPGPPVLTGGDREREGNEPDVDNESVGPSAVLDENKSDWKSTVSAMAKLLREVRDSADTFPPLKSAVGGLYFILENCEV